MEIELVHIEIKKIEIDFQKIYDYITENEDRLIDTIDSYDIIFGDNIEHYLQYTHDLNFNTNDMSYYELNDNEYIDIANGFYNWLKENKDRLKLKDD